MEEKSVDGCGTQSLESPWATGYWKQGEYSAAKYCHIFLVICFWLLWGILFCTNPKLTWNESGRIWWLREQNILSALSPCFPAPSIRSLHWPYNNKAGSPIYSGEIPGVSGNFDLQYIHFQKPLLTCSKSPDGIRGRFQWFLNALQDPDPLL